MDLGIAGKVALVTGGSRGIGRACSHALAAEGAKVAVASRTQADVDAVAGEVGGRGYAFDSADLDAISPLVDAVERDLGPVDIYVANTGGPPPGADPLRFSAEQWEEAARTLVISPMKILERVVPGMRDREFGRVVSISSSAVREPIPPLQLSNAYRPGVVAAFKNLARENARHNVTFNTVMPGRIATDRLVGNYGSMEEAARQAQSEVPAGRLGTPDELAAVVAFLASTQAAYVTGQWVIVDGGLTRSV